MDLSNMEAFDTEAKKENKQAVDSAPKAFFKKVLDWFQSQEPKKKRMIAGVAALLILSIVLICVGGGGGSKPQGTYVAYVAGMKFASYEFKGNKVEYFLLGNTNKGTFQMVDGNVLIEYEDGGYDQFQYDAEKDELSMAGAVTLTREK